MDFVWTRPQPRGAPGWTASLDKLGVKGDDISATRKLLKKRLHVGGQERVSLVGSTAGVGGRKTWRLNGDTPPGSIQARRAPMDRLVAWTQRADGKIEVRGEK